MGGSGGDLRRARVAPTGEGERDGFPPSWGQAVRGNNGGREGSPPPVFTGAGSRREDNEGKGNKIPRLRFAALGMTCGPGKGRGMDSRLRGGRLFAGTTEGGMGPRPPVFTGAGSRREDNEGEGCEIPGICFAALGMTCGPGRRRGMGSLNSQTKCNSLLGCCHGKAI